MKIRIAGSGPVNLLLQQEKKIASASCLSLKDGHAQSVLNFLSLKILKLLPCQHVTYTHTDVQCVVYYTVPENSRMLRVLYVHETLTYDYTLSIQ